jgi:hypothetical protein
VKRRPGFRFPADPHIMEVVVTAAASVPASFYVRHCPMNHLIDPDGLQVGLDLAELGAIPIEGVLHTQGS